MQGFSRLTKSFASSQGLLKETLRPHAWLFRLTRNLFTRQPFASSQGLLKETLRPHARLFPAHEEFIHPATIHPINHYLLTKKTKTLIFAPDMTMSAGTPFQFLDQDLLLLPQKAIYWQQEKALLAADVHFGKVGHFRKAGIAIPRNMEQDDLAVLSDLIHEYQPEKLIFLGDLFHSDMNNDWDWFVLWRSQFPKLQITLIKGNHDIISDKYYTQLGIILHKELIMGPFLMLHHPLTDPEVKAEGGYVLCGHIHPGVSLVGRGRQSVTLPCFAFGKNQAILPSFGKFTGKVAILSRKADRIFGVLKDKVIAIG